MRSDRVPPSAAVNERSGSVDGTAMTDAPASPTGAGGRGRGRLVAQVALAVAAWVFVGSLSRENDGLWLLYDASNHLANGLFVTDYLASGLPGPAAYHRSYFVRYPNVCVERYPPGFYLLEAAVFSAVGTSPAAVLGLVLAFALLLVLYQVAWLRRFVAPGAGYLGGVVLMVPAVVLYSHAVVLNVPASALQLGTLYHARCGLVGLGRRHLFAAAALGVAAVSCYQGALVLLPVLGWWLVASGRWRLLLRPRVALLAAVILSPPALLFAWILRAAGQANWLYDTPYLGYLVTWLWYPSRMPGAFGPVVLAGAAFGAAAGIIRRRWRSELAYSGGWIVVTYLFHTYLFGKDVRYIVPLAAPLVSLAAVAVWSLAAWVRRVLGGRMAAAWAATVVAILLGVHAWLAHSIEVPRLEGFDEAVAAIRSDAGDDRGSILVSLQDSDWTVLTTYVRLADPDFRLRVLPATWLWQLAGFERPSGPPPPGAADAHAIDSALTHSGCRWIIAQVERASRATPPRPLDRRLGAVLASPRFRLMGTFSILRPEPITVLLYRQDGPLGGLPELVRRRGSPPTGMEWLLRDPITRDR